MKRFYTLVSTQKESGGFSIMLDGKPVKTPMRGPLLCGTEALANEVVKEWAAQEELIKPDTMPLTQLLSTRLDQVTTQREDMTAAVLKYLDTDLLCYRTDQPPELAVRQAQAWDKWLAWFTDEFGETLETTTTLKALKQGDTAHQKSLHYVKSLNDDYFTILQLITPLSGSIVLALAFVKQKISPQELFNAIRVEEQFQAEIYDEEKYGPDPAQEKKDAAIKVDLEAAARYLRLVG